MGCGCGGTMAELASAVGETGAAVGVDIAEAMVTVARQRFPTNRYPGIRFRAAIEDAFRRLGARLAKRRVVADLYAEGVLPWSTTSG
ncbi:methyltransferase domain-containing protein [Micromonospora peucetia]|uniref:methyltransferase domain-containing protein n=1 Tax=Micromonospora peucetia TaxID=47871 RepID=UPI00331FF7B8